MTVLQTAADEMRELRAEYAEVVGRLNKKMEDDDVTEVEDLLESKVDVEDERAMNRGLWESLEQIRAEKSKLANRIRQLEGWCRDQGFGTPEEYEEMYNEENQYEGDGEEEE